MSAHVRSVNVGTPRGGFTRSGASGIVKEPVASITVRDPGPKRGGLGSGVVGDAVLNRTHHGGSRQAVYAVAREELDWWGAELGRDLPDGMFGENLTTQGLAVDAAVVGEKWRVGESVVLEVAAPRIPCSTFAARMGVKGWVRRFSERGHTGAYLAIVVPGEIRSGDPIEVIDRPDHGITVPDWFRAIMGDRELAARVLASGALDEESAADLRRRSTGPAPSA